MTEKQRKRLRGSEKARRDRAKRAAAARWKAQEEFTPYGKTPRALQEQVEKLKLEAKALRTELKSKKPTKKEKEKLEKKKRAIRNQRRRIRRYVERGIREDRFTDIMQLPRKMIHESKMEYAKRLVHHIIGQAVYSAEEAYRPIAEKTGLTAREVYTLFMSPEAA